MCIMAVVSISTYSLIEISFMHFHDSTAHASYENNFGVIINNKGSSQEFTFQKITKQHVIIDTPPETIEPGTQIGIYGGGPNNAFDDGIVHIYYNYGNNSGAEFSGWWEPTGECEPKSTSPEIKITCHQDSKQNKFTITDASS